MRKATSKAQTQALAKGRPDELATLAALPEDEINTSDIPEQRDWSGARRGVFFRPLKKQLTLRLDADVVDWFKARTTAGKGYQTDINSALRQFVARHDRSEVRPGKGFAPPSDGALPAKDRRHRLAQASKQRPVDDAGGG